MSLCHRTPLLLALSVVLGATAARGQTLVNVAFGKPVTGIYYNSDSEVFPAANITDGRFDDSGTAYNWSFWLSPNGVVNTTLTIDLLGQYSISSFVLQNSHNRGYFDRGTQGFALRISSDGSNYTTLFTGSFTADEWSNLSLRTITLATPAVGQYLQFETLSIYGGYSAGLNELQAFGTAVPEPATAILLGTGLAALGAVVLRRRARIAR